MRLDGWLATLRAANRPLEPTLAIAAARRAVQRAQAASGGRFAYQVTPTPSGARIRVLTLPSTTPAQVRAAEKLLRRSLERETEQAKRELATEVRGRLTP